MGVGVGQKLKATVRRADGTRTSGQRRERYASSQRGWGIRRPTKGQRPSIAGPQGTCTRGDRAARPECLCRDLGFGRVAATLCLRTLFLASGVTSLMGEADPCKLGNSHSPIGR